MKEASHRKQGKGKGIVCENTHMHTCDLYQQKTVQNAARHAHEVSLRRKMPKNPGWLGGVEVKKRNVRTFVRPFFLGFIFVVVIGWSFSSRTPDFMFSSCVSRLLSVRTALERSPRVSGTAC